MKVSDPTREMSFLNLSENNRIDDIELLAFEVDELLEIVLVQAMTLKLLFANESKVDFMSEKADSPFHFSRSKSADSGEEPLERLFGPSALQFFNFPIKGEDFFSLAFQRLFQCLTLVEGRSAWRYG